MLEELDTAIRAECPIHGVSSSGRIDFHVDASPEQQAEAKRIMEEWDFQLKRWREGSKCANASETRKRNASLEAAAMIVETIDETEDPLLLAVRELVFVLLEEIQGVKAGKPQSSKPWNEHKQATAARLRAKKT